LSKPEKPPIQDLSSERHMRYGVSPVTEKLIGRFIVEWSRLEALIGDMIWVILDVKEEDGRIVTARVDAKTKLQWLKAFSARYLEGKELEHIAQIVNVIEIVQESRNLVVHASWGTFVQSGDPIAMSLRPKAEPDKILTESFPRDRLEELIENTIAARNEIAKWRKKHEDRPGRRSKPLHT
jgi:hypothetical protein